MKNFFRSHRLAISVILVAILASAVSVGYLGYSVQRKIDANRQKSAQNSQNMDKEIATIKTEKTQLATGTTEKAEAKKNSKQVPQDTSAAHAAATDTHRDSASIEVIVNKKHPIQPRDYRPRVATVSCGWSGTATINTVAVSDFQALCKAAKQAGVPLSTSSSYRSYSVQASTYNYWVHIDGKAGADRVSARPGYSEHQTGLAVDFSVPHGASLDHFCGTKQQKWLAKHASTYGWIQRYTSANSRQTGYDPECWHYRYIGRANAKAFIASGALSLEAYWHVSGGLY